ncbi:small membrane A-kinase anchor protein isoform X1 [Pantherophis guttatus]|uniref:Small membrane A-kinase anchor protein n=2 Tax=Pantherophis guttatus TaxID=94885 RepID=A0A6P9CQT4_PANGU|nr:small membrane A-kinase anchor protein isoform X1 [Pantherophis guttatus]
MNFCCKAASIQGNSHLLLHLVKDHVGQYIGRSAYSHLCLQESDILYPSKGQYIKADCAAKLNSSRTMGCIKSKSPFPHTILDDGSREVGKFDSGCNLEKSSLIQANSGMPSSTNTAVLDFAHRLSLEILDQAVKQWAINESKYSDIPFIESDEP